LRPGAYCWIGGEVMDKPLLALTRLNQHDADGPVVESAAVENMRQLIQLRWIAVAGQTLTIVLAHRLLGVPLAVGPMLGLTVFLGAANLVATMALARRRVLNSEIMLALLLDMTALTLQLHFSGGASNPFIALYLLQVVLGAILLPQLWAGLLVVTAALSYALVSVWYVPLDLPQPWPGADADLLAVGGGIAFLMVASLLVFFIARISRNLRARDAYLADLRQHAAEEEGIVRMGLFASGAAHELGTPLGTLAVILADWRRVPTIARDPELLAEVQEMQAEIQRCKGIVSDILHSAGQPRGESMESASAANFLDVAVESWRLTHPDALLDYRCEGIAAAMIAVNPALRQAIWSLLDNAAEASPVGLSLVARPQGPSLVIAVRDKGPGFPPEVLAHVGKLYQSTKGVGHGLGLFLAANVARRLGGRLEATNAAEGGADVRLILPLAATSKGVLR
jgi:two-component system sensor histidine kinase RegB